MIAFAGMVLANAATLLGARRIVGTVSGRPPEVTVLLVLLSRLALISLAVLVFGALGALTPLALGLAGLVFLAGAVALRRPQFVRLQLPRDLATVLAGLLLVRMLLQAWFWSPYQADVVSYALPKVAEWVQQGTLRTGIGQDPRAWFPSGFELIETWWVVFLKHDVLIELAGAEFLLLGASAVAAVATRLGLERPSAVLAGVLFASMPGMMVLATACQNDPAVAALLAATTALLLHRAPVPWVLVAVGLGTGLKPTFLMALPGLAALELWLRRRSPRVPEPGRPWPAWGLAVLSILAGLVWYARNAILHGTPIYPAGRPECPWYENVTPTLGQLFTNVGNLVNDRIYDRQRAVSELLSLGAGWGAAAFGFGIPGLVLALRRGGPVRAVTAALGASILVVLLLVKPEPWNLRFVLFFPMLLAVAAADLVHRLPTLRAPLAAVVCLSIVGTVFTDEMDRKTFRMGYRPEWRNRTFITAYVGDVPDDRVGSYGRVGPLSYWLYRPDFSRQVVYLNARTLPELLETLRRDRVSTFLFHSRPDHFGEGAVVREGVKTGQLKSLGGFWYVLVPK